MSAPDIVVPVESLLRQSGAAAATGAALYTACILLAFVLHCAGDRGTRSRLCWLIAACSLMAFGGIEALGLPARIVDAVRACSIAQGWYETRGGLQLEFILALVVMYAVAAVCAAPLLPPGCGLKGAARALGLLPIFIIIRAASLHELDHFFRLRIAGLVRISSLIEALILLFIFVRLIKAYRMGIPGDDSFGCQPPKR